MRSIAAVALLCAVPMKAVMPAIPRPSPPFTITQPSGKKTPLASYRGKVVVLAWVHTNCQYCQALTLKLNKLQKRPGAARVSGAGSGLERRRRATGAGVRPEIRGGFSGGL